MKFDNWYYTDDTEEVREWKMNNPHKPERYNIAREAWDFQDQRIESLRDYVDELRKENQMLRKELEGYDKE